MHKSLLPAVLAATFLATPAAAADRGFYAGLEGGLWLVEDINADSEGDFFGGFPLGITAQLAVPSGDNIAADLKTGYDVDAIAGFDWGWVRTEAEVSVKRAAFDQVAIGDDLFFAGKHDADGYIRSFTLMANVLADVPLGSGWNVSVGPGFGWGKLKVHAKADLENNGTTAKLNDETDSGWLWQLTGGVRKRVTSNLDAGLKYRYVNTGKRKYDSGFYGDVEGKLQAHSVLASLIYNFGAPAAPAAPAAQ